MEFSLEPMSLIGTLNEVLGLWVAEECCNQTCCDILHRFGHRGTYMHHSGFAWEEFWKKSEGKNLWQQCRQICKLCQTVSDPPFQSNKCSIQPLEVVCSDLCGAIQVPSLGKNKCILTFLDVSKSRSISRSLDIACSTYWRRRARLGVAPFPIGFPSQLRNG